MHILHQDVIFAFSTNSNANAIMIFSFLYEMVAILENKLYPKFTAIDISENLVFIYELLDGFFLNKTILEIKIRNH